MCAWDKLQPEQGTLHGPLPETGPQRPGPESKGLNWIDMAKRGSPEPGWGRWERSALLLRAVGSQRGGVGTQGMGDTVETLLLLLFSH